MRVYYIKDDVCIDVNKKMANIGNGMVRIAPIVAGTFTAIQIGCKIFVVSTSMYGVLKAGEAIGFLATGIADQPLIEICKWATNIVK